ncbi:MAG: hypothetical protein HY675_15130 [Chloroflexi bacterium]|nr:hypothetical protein [Chloroflexota bacterium]
MLEAKCRTTAMGIMPHASVDRAISLALELDMPFWPQLPNVSYFEDMYAQASEHFPGIVVDEKRGTLSFDTARFAQDLEQYAQVCDLEETFELSLDYSATFHAFLARDLGRCAAIRGQVIGPVSFGFRVTDETRRPVIYNDEVRPLLFEFLQKKANRQYAQLLTRNPNAFVWLDEPGLAWVFSALSGYGDDVAREEYRRFFAGIQGPKALHLCADVNLPYLLDLGTDIVSFDVYQIGGMPGKYAAAVGRFIQRGGVVSWGLVPTDSVNQGRETPETLVERLEGIWRKVAEHGGVPPTAIAEKSLLAPARCCLKNVGRVGAAEDAACTMRPDGSTSTDEERLVETAFGYLKIISCDLQHRYSLANQLV